MCSPTSSEGPQLVKFAASAVCTNKGGHRDTFLNKQCEAPCVLRGQLNRPPSLERSKTRFSLCHNLVVDSTEREHRHCSGEFEQPASKGVVYEHEVILWY